MMRPRRAARCLAVLLAAGAAASGVPAAAAPEPESATALLMPPLDLSGRSSDPYVAAIKKTYTPGCTAGRMSQPADARWNKYFEGPTELGTFKREMFYPQGANPRPLSSEETRYFRWMQRLAGLALTPGVPMDVSMYAACVFKRQMIRERQSQDDQQIDADVVDDANAQAIPITTSQAATIAALAGAAMPLPASMVLETPVRGGGGGASGLSRALSKVRSDPKLLRHLEEDEGFSADSLQKSAGEQLDRGQGIRGAHNRDSFVKAFERLQKEGKVRELHEFQSTDVPGLSKVTYKAVNSEGKLKLCVKTLYDPKRLPVQKWLQWGFKAYRNALESGGVTTRSWAGRVKLPSGKVLTFRGWFGPDGLLSTFYPENI